jgi:hypothetical protein
MKRIAALVLLFLCVGRADAQARGSSGHHSSGSSSGRSYSHRSTYGGMGMNSRSYSGSYTRSASHSLGIYHRSSVTHYHASSASIGPSHFHAFTSRSAVGVRRDSQGRIARSSTARYEFMSETGYPHGRPGYVVDHTIPLKRGGADDPSNMQWQTKEEAKAKDRWE